MSKVDTTIFTELKITAVQDELEPDTLFLGSEQDEDLAQVHFEGKHKKPMLAIFMAALTLADKVYKPTGKQPWEPSEPIHTQQSMGPNASVLRASDIEGKPDQPVDNTPYCKWCKHLRHNVEYDYDTSPPGTPAYLCVHSAFTGDWFGPNEKFGNPEVENADNRCSRHSRTKTALQRVNDDDAPQVLICDPWGYEDGKCHSAFTPCECGAPKPDVPQREEQD